MERGGNLVWRCIMVKNGREIGTIYHLGIGPHYLIPGHCTGWVAIHEIARTMPEAFIANAEGVGWECANQRAVAAQTALRGVVMSASSVRISRQTV
jgi:hypothetical protein